MIRLWLERYIPMPSPELKEKSLFQMRSESVRTIIRPFIPWRAVTPVISPPRTSVR